MEKSKAGGADIRVALEEGAGTWRHLHELRALRAAALSRRGVASSPAANATARSTSVIATALRGRGLASASPALQDVIAWPRERLGLDYALNWSLAADDIIAGGDAYFNATPEMLAKRLAVKPSGNAVTLAAPVPTGGPPILEAGGDAIDFDMFDELRDQVLRHLSSGVELYVVDAAIGVADIAVGVRVVTDSAACALVARNLLVPLPAGPPASQPVTVYLAAGAADTSSALGAVQYEEGEKGALAGATVLLSGMPSQAAIASAIFKAASALLLEKDGVAPLPAAVLTGKGGRTALYVELGPEDAATALAKGVLAAAHHSIWGPAGVSPFWGGAMAGGSGRSTGKGELAALVQGVATAPLAAGAAAMAAPVAVFVGGAAGAVDADVVAKAMRAAGADEDGVERLAAAMQVNKTLALGVHGVAQALDFLNK